jgi:hypothetical protein
LLGIDGDSLSKLIHGTIVPAESNRNNPHPCYASRHVS